MSLCFALEELIIEALAMIDVKDLQPANRLLPPAIHNQPGKLNKTFTLHGSGAAVP
jgi:hypothetical protein